jgi:hypothetical protein
MLPRAKAIQTSPDQRSLISMADAERDTHITKQQVSRWRKALDQ